MGNLRLVGVLVELSRQCQKSTAFREYFLCNLLGPPRQTLTPLYAGLFPGPLSTLPHIRWSRGQVSIM